MRTTKQPDGTWYTIDRNGNQFYSKDLARTIFHRLDGPAIEYANGSKVWWANGKLHRIDGPAVERIDKSNAWYVDGEPYCEEDFNRLFSRYKDPTDKQVMLDMETMFK